MAEEPTARTSLDALDLESLSDEELKRLTQLLMSERERRMGLEPGPAMTVSGSESSRNALALLPAGLT